MSKEEVLDLWNPRFGMSEEAFEGCRFYRKAQSIWVISDEDIPPFTYEALGLRMISLKDRPWKPTTCALQVFGKYATKNVVHLNDSQAKAFLAGERQPLETECEPGYVVVFYGSEVLGCGLYSRGALASQLPKERRIAGCMDGRIDNCMGGCADMECEDNR
jgi:NOL1/NOP2/fmu family ribosome biogenesis protein